MNYGRESERIISVDVLRGLIIFLMIFVNDIAGLAHTPRWLKHVSASVDGMTIPDVVFPAFIFVMGMSIPIAIGRRLDSGQSWYIIIWHILLRTVSLLIIGILTVNYPDDQIIGWPRGLWKLLMLTSVFMVWHTVPKQSTWLKKISFLIRFIGCVLLLFAALLFRDSSGQWLSIKWWGILGLIGWAYVIASCIYLLTHDNRTLLSGTIALLICVYIAFREGGLSGRWFNGGTVGAHPAIAVAGVLLGTIVRSSDILYNKKILKAAVFIGFMALTAWLLRPLYGISKIGATPSWCLYTSAITCAVWIALYWLIDVKGIIRWSGFFQSAGLNALFAYLFSSLMYSVFQVTHIGYFSFYDSPFFIGLVRSAVFTISINYFSGWTGKSGIRLKL
ncbi:MAG: DUF5009 domain-containing protein [Candidatus Latescibacteria bacterium]|nr:DUF5009 domain-containing protein [Candidatus Latescibacterota bacterium]